MHARSERARGRLPAALLLLTTLVILGCPAPPLPPPDELLQQLSRAVLDPQTTCEELRDAYGLVDLVVGEDPGDFGLVYEEHKVRTATGELLRVWFLPAAEARGVVILSPGNSGPMQCYLLPAILLINGGWSTVIYDYEGFGGSSGVPSLRGLRGDLEAVLDWTLLRTGLPQASLFGLSLGSIPSIAVAGERPGAVNGVILDSPVAMREEIRRFNYFLRGRAEDIIEALDPWLLTEETIRNVGQPLLVYLHELDVISTPRAVEALYDAAGGPKQLVRFPDVPHALGQFVRTAEYDAALQQFLEQVWPATPPAVSGAEDRLH